MLHACWGHCLTLLSHSCPVLSPSLSFSLAGWLGAHPNVISLKDLVVDVAADELYLMMDLMDTDLHRIIVSPQPLGDAHYKHFM